MICNNHRQTAVTIVERASNSCDEVKEVERKTADAVAEAAIELLRTCKDRVLTITADRGKEFAHHSKVARMLQCDCYFAHPHSSWEWGARSQTAY